MSGRQHALVTLVGALAVVACEDGPVAGGPPQFNVAGNGNGVIVEVGEHRAPFGLIVTDPENQLVVYYRWDNGFCGAGAPAPTEFVNSTYRDIVRIDESWHTLDKTEDYWVYVYPWNGTPAFPGCNFLRNTPRLATGRADRLLVDNDFYPFDPYGPGPGANAYMLKLAGVLTTAAGRPAVLSVQTHIVVDPDGSTIRRALSRIRLSPDPRN